ncbi:MAG: aminomethyl-transferring glycine dehydrogenase subunit GcvPB [Bacillota bacterium]|nr:aminomethyl-transferring glycine dehydrogenase subunit GcvPB [Bacillota bacterium]
MKGDFPTIFERGGNGLSSVELPSCSTPSKDIKKELPETALRKSPPKLPEVPEPELVRHYTALSRRNHGVDNGFYPLGSCTMKYNPKMNEDIAAMDAFSSAHPLAPVEAVQGCLEAMYGLQEAIAGITGMDAVCLQGAAGAHGELTSLMMLKSYLKDIGEESRNRIIVPDSSHGTNPASATLAGFTTVQIKSGIDGKIALAALEAALGDDVAGLMLTNPNTLGIFETEITKIADMVHSHGGLLYYDGANLNAIAGIARPGDMGFDMVHLNLHKTFSTPHGGGGPGSGPVAVKAALEKYLPNPKVVKNSDGSYGFACHEASIGMVKSFWGNFGVMLKALAYIFSLGWEGLEKASETAVLNANYCLEMLKNDYVLPYEGRCMHEFVLSAENLAAYGVRAMDVAKALIDYGIHPPTIYFPLIVKEALMIEPTETESKQTLDGFISAMKQIAKTARENPQALRDAPKTTPVGRLDEVGAARNPVLKSGK